MTEQIHRSPLVTFALLHYNQQDFVERAMESALAQDYSPLEIIVSDDCSTDATWDVIQKVAGDYKGRHQLRILRNQSNMGIGPHVGKVGMMASGDLVVQADGDDVSYPHRVSSLVREWARHGFASGALHSAVLRRSDGSDPGSLVHSPASDPRKASLDYFVKNHFRALMNGASIAYTKDVFTEFPPIDSDFEDIPLTLRALLLGKLMYVNEPLVEYCSSDGSVSRPLRRSDKQRVIEWFMTIERNIAFMEQDYLYHAKQNSMSMNPAVAKEFRSVKKKCRTAVDLASSSPIKLIKAMTSYPYDVPIKQRVAFHLAFFGLLR